MQQRLRRRARISPKAWGAGKETGWGWGGAGRWGRSGYAPIACSMLWPLIRRAPVGRRRRPRKLLRRVAMVCCRGRGYLWGVSARGVGRGEARGALHTPPWPEKGGGATQTLTRTRQQAPTVDVCGSIQHARCARLYGLVRHQNPLQCSRYVQFLARVPRRSQPSRRQSLARLCTASQRWVVTLSRGTPPPAQQVGRSRPLPAGARPTCPSTLVSLAAAQALKPDHGNNIMRK